MLGKHPTTIWHWRMRHGLRKHRKFHGRKRMATKEEKRRLLAYARGLSDYELAKELGMSVFGVRSWRRSRNLVGHPKYTYKHCFLSLEEERRRNIVYYSNPHLGDYRMARLLGITQPSFKEWRTTRGLPPHCRQKRGHPMKKGFSMDQYLNVRPLQERQANEVAIHEDMNRT